MNPVLVALSPHVRYWSPVGERPVVPSRVVRDYTYAYGAASHRSPELKLPEHMSLLHLPPYSPELNPQENVWAQ